MTAKEMYKIIENNPLATEYLKRAIEFSFKQKKSDVLWLRDFLNVLIDEDEFLRE